MKQNKSFYLKSSKKKYFLRNIKGKKYFDNILILQDAVYYDFDHFIKFLENQVLKNYLI